MNIFLCDIAGTFDSKDYKNRSNSLSRFINNLNDIIDKNNLDNLFFCFITGDNIDYLKNYFLELKNNINDLPIIFGPQFACNGVIINNELIKTNITNKVDQIIKLLSTNNVESIFLAEDSNINHKIIERIIEKKYPNIKLIHFVPGTPVNDKLVFGSKNKDIDGLNECIEKYISKKKIKTIGNL